MSTIRFIGRRAQVFGRNGVCLLTTGPAHKQGIREHLLLLRNALNDAIVDGHMVIDEEPVRKMPEDRRKRREPT